MSAFIMAVLSYYFIERLFLRIRDRVRVAPALAAGDQPAQ
jgi:peptidoglycan/LPS O-acetylase OafA/YrhL